MVPSGSQDGHQNSRATAGAIHGKSEVMFLVKGKEAVSCPVTEAYLNTASALCLQHSQKERMPLTPPPLQGDRST